MSTFYKLSFAMPWITVLYRFV